MIHCSRMARKWKSWAAAALITTYGVLTQANQAVSNVQFLRSIPGWQSAVRLLFSGAHVLAGPAMFFGGAWLVLLMGEAAWNGTIGRRRKKIVTRTRDYSLTAQEAINYIALESKLSISFVNNNWMLALAAFMANAKNGKIKLAGRPPTGAELVEITLSELASLEPLVHYMPRAQTVAVLSASPFALINQAGDAIIYESVLCDPSEIAIAWPPRFHR